MATKKSKKKIKKSPKKTRTKRKSSSKPTIKPTQEKPFIIEGGKGTARIFYIDWEKENADWTLEDWGSEGIKKPVYRVQIRTKKKAGTNAQDFPTAKAAEQWAKEKLGQQDKPKTASEKPRKKKKKTASEKPRKKKKKTASEKRPKKRKKKKKTRPAFETRDDELPPEGFTINLGEVSQDEAYAVILARLEDARANLPEGYSGRITIHPYADGSVDGELYIRLDEGIDSIEAEFDFYEAFTSISVGRQYWISTGARYQVETDDERYKRNKGMTQVQTNYQRATPSNIAEEHLILRHSIMPGMAKKFGEEAEEGKLEARDIFIRLHWNPENEQPKR